MILEFQHQQSWDSVISTMEFPLLVRWPVSLEMDPGGNFSILQDISSLWWISSWQSVVSPSALATETMYGPWSRTVCLFLYLRVYFQVCCCSVRVPWAFIYQGIRCLTTRSCEVPKPWNWVFKLTYIVVPKFGSVLHSTAVEMPITFQSIHNQTNQTCGFEISQDQRPLLPTWINFNPSMDK